MPNLEFIRESSVAANMLVSVILAFVTVQTADASPQLVERDFAGVTAAYLLTSNLIYHRANGIDLKLDVYRPRVSPSPNPTLMYIHGGGWTNGNKESSSLAFLPYLEMGWSVVNVSYRLAEVAHAPAAVEDTRCALRWIYRNAEEYNFDRGKIVVTGNSAGGHLALTTGMLNETDGLDAQCPGDRMRTWDAGPRNIAPLKVAAIVNWYGITDVIDLLDNGPGSSGNFTGAWLGSSENRRDTAIRITPIELIKAGSPPIMTIHGTNDTIVPYDQGLRLHSFLNEAGVPNQLITVEGGGHGGFSVREMQSIFDQIQEFLAQYVL